MQALIEASPFVALATFPGGRGSDCVAAGISPASCVSRVYDAHR